ncbi:hypothetical protein H4582DRAFT_1809756, partial [Lactarius indigo]
EVRKFAMALMGRKNRNSQFSLPSKSEFERFEDRNYGGPTREDFRVQLVGSLACNWNRRTADIFARMYIKKKKCHLFKHEDLAACFKVHLRTLKNQYKRIKAGSKKKQVDVKHVSTSACCTCRQGASVLLINADSHADEYRIAHHLNKLGAEGMSGDESDHSGGHWHYVVCKLNWRSDEVTHVLQVLDALVLVSHWTTNGQPRPGKFPHV